MGSGHPSGGLFIEAKTKVPRPGERALFRTHVLDRLSAGGGRSLTVVSGPVASGKTALVSQWIDRERLPAFWYSFDASDDSWEVFLRRLVSVFSDVPDRHVAEGGGPLRELLALPAPEALLRFMHWAAEAGPFLFVLDNFHTVTSGAIIEAVVRSVEYASPGMRFAIVGRQSPPFSVARLRLKEQLTEVSPRDLCFTEDETERFFARVFGIRLSKGQLREVMRRMEGWAGGMQLFGSLLRDKSTSEIAEEALNKACRDGEDYLIDEVIDRQPEEVVEFLRSTSLLDRFTADLCREVTRRADASAMLDYLDRNNLFLVPLDSEGKWYRYHYLFRKAIGRRAALAAGQASRLDRRAVAWMAQNGLVEDALDHAFSRRDYRIAARLLEEHATALYRGPRFSSFLGWISQLPRDLFREHPLLALYECRFKMESMQWAGLDSALADIESRSARFLARYDDATKTLCRDLFVLLKCLPYCFDPEHLDTRGLEKGLLQLSPHNESISAIAMVLVARACMYQGRMTEASDVLKKVSPSVLSSSSIIGAALWFRMMATIERLQWRLSDSERVLKEGFSFLRRSGAPELRPLLYVPAATICYLRNDLPRALKLATLAVRYAERAGFAYEIADGNFLLCIIYRALNQGQRIGPCVKEIQRAAKIIGSPSYIALTEAFLARFWALGGDISSADGWAQSRRLTPDGSFSYRYVTECLAQAQICYAGGKVREAANIVEAVYDRCLEHSMMQDVLEMDLLSAAAFHSLHKSGQSRERMEHAVGLAEAERSVAVFVNRSRLISPVLTDMVTARLRGRKLGYLPTIATACGIERHGAGGNGQTRASEECLTPRETQIFNFMALGFKNKEIAEKAFISLDTVRTHMKHIFEKLGAKSRVQAIRRAEELKLL
jgi:LuxR family transcriptional regulator, maltose regulon positive regulatory protein